MIIGSHNSWSYLPSKKWYLTPFKFIAKCQDLNIYEQYVHGVKCFDLRIRWNKKGVPEIAHGFMVYKITLSEILEHLDFLNNKKDCYVRVILEVRTKKQYTDFQIDKFNNFCKFCVKHYDNIKFWCGRNLYNWNEDFKFDIEPTCAEKYSSVCSPRIIDDWYPRLFARINNKKIIRQGTSNDILLIDFVNYGC